ncbi:MAG: hypothetical protein ACKOX6_17705 [Bdellovibrio sp.]
MKNAITTVTKLLSITTVLLSAKANATEVQQPNRELPNTEEVQSQLKMVGFAPSKAINTLEALSEAGASHFNEQGATEVSVSSMGKVIQAANKDKLQVSILPSNKEAYVLVKFIEKPKVSAELDSSQKVKVRKLSGKYQLKCDGGTTDMMPY